MIRIKLSLYMAASSILHKITGHLEGLIVDEDADAYLLREQHQLYFVSNLSGTHRYAYLRIDPCVHLKLADRYIPVRWCRWSRL